MFPEEKQTDRMNDTKSTSVTNYSAGPHLKARNVRNVSKSRKKITFVSNFTIENTKSFKRSYHRSSLSLCCLRFESLWMPFLKKIAEKSELFEFSFWVRRSIENFYSWKAAENGISNSQKGQDKANIEGGSEIPTAEAIRAKLFSGHLCRIVRV